MPVSRLGFIIVGRFSAVLGILILSGGIALAMGLGSAERTTERTKQLPVGYQSTQAAELAAAAPTGTGTAAVLLITSRDGTTISAQAQADARQAILGLSIPAVSGPLGGPEGIAVSDDGSALLATVIVDEVEASELKPLVTDLRSTLRAATPTALQAEITGPAAIQADLAQVFDGANVRLLTATAGVVALLLILTYRSPVLFLVPLTVIGIAEQAAASLATHVVEALGIAWDGSTTGILSVLVFGAGTNYALLLISRYRDELRQEEDRFQAMRTALARTAEPVLASASTVVIGLLCLLFSVIPTTRGLGVACAVGIAIAAFFALVALPAILVLFGRWIFWPRRPEPGTAELADQETIWSRIGGAVSARPRTLVLGSVALVAALATGLGALSLGLPTSEQFLDQPESIAASERLTNSFPAGSAEPVTVWTSESDSARKVVTGLPGIATIDPGPSVGDQDSLRVVLSDPSGSDAAEKTVLLLRSALDEAGLTASVGGTTAETIDTDDANTRDRLVLFPLIAVLVLLALGLLLRSAVAPVLLVLTVLATFAAALGASWWLFTGVFGFTGVDSGMPLLAFLFLVALGVDYNIFLVSRAWEEIAKGHPPKVAMRRALTATGGVITSAGVLLAAVFAVLGVLPLVLLAQLGATICIGVLLDTLVVRTVLVPGLAILLGDRFWWPRKAPSAA